MGVRALAIYSSLPVRWFTRLSSLLPFLFLWICHFPDGDPAYAKETKIPGNMEYGISCKTDQISRDTVKRHQNLSKILLAHNVPYSVINDAAIKSKSVFDVRRLKAGNPYCIIRQPESGQPVRYFVYEQDPINFVVYDLGNPVRVYTGEKEIEIKIREAAGGIQSSLSRTFSRLGLEYELSKRLSDVYAWTVDFHHLGKGDHFRFLYEEKYAGGDSVGLGNIVAAKFHHRGQDHYGFFYEPDGRGMYYDEAGNSMEKVFLKAPLRYTRISSMPSKRRLHPILKIHRPHLGTDYAAPIGTPVYSVGDGVVFKKGYHRESGRYITVKHNGVYKSQYLHLNKFAMGLKRGRVVKRGDVIGYVGRTGLATGPHLDFRFWKNGRVINHLKERMPAGEALAQQHLPPYRAYVQKLKARLDNMPLHESINLAKK